MATLQCPLKYISFSFLFPASICWENSSLPQLHYDELAHPAFERTGIQPWFHCNSNKDKRATEEGLYDTFYWDMLSCAVIYLTRL